MFPINFLVDILLNYWQQFNRIEFNNCHVDFSARTACSIGIVLHSMDYPAMAVLKFMLHFSFPLFKAYIIGKASTFCLIVVGNIYLMCNDMA
jgi:competence transcription factor ComK